MFRILFLILFFISSLYFLNADPKQTKSNNNSAINSITDHQTQSMADSKNPAQDKTQDKSYNSLDMLINFIVQTNYYLRLMDEMNVSEIAKQRIDTTYINALQSEAMQKDVLIDSDIFTKNKTHITRDMLVESKEVMLDSMPFRIINNKKPLLFSIQRNTQDSKALESKILESKIAETTNIYDEAQVILNTIKLNSLKAKNAFYQSINKLRKNLDIFSSQAKVNEILSPVLKELQALPNTFNIPQGLTKDKKDSINHNLIVYLNEVATYIEILSYLDMNSLELLPKNTIINITMHWLVQKISHFITIDYSNMMMTKIILSLVIFIVLWAYRRLVARFIIYLTDFIVHISNHDKELHNEIQKGILKPISLLMLAWSINVSIGILYYPSVRPEASDKWFDIFYVINVAWLFIAIIKSYGAAFISTLAQKSDGFRREIINLIIKILYSIVGIIALLVVLHKLGFNVSTLIASLGLGGLAVALAVKDMLANFFASVMLLLDNSFSQGDWIVCGNVEGNVVEIGLRKTTVRTSDNALLFVPNSELAGKVIKNWNRRKEGRRIKLDFALDISGVDFIYSSDSSGDTHAQNPVAQNLRECVAKITDMLENHPEIASSKNNTLPDYLNPTHKDLSVRKDIISISDYLGYKNSLFVRITNIDKTSASILVECYTKSISKADFLRVQEDVILRSMQIIKERGLWC